MHLSRTLSDRHRCCMCCSCSRRARHYRRPLYRAPPTLSSSSATDNASESSYVIQNKYRAPYDLIHIYISKLNREHLAGIASHKESVLILLALCALPCAGEGAGHDAVRGQPKSRTQPGARGWRGGGGLKPECWRKLRLSAHRPQHCMANLQINVCRSWTESIGKSGMGSQIWSAFMWSMRTWGTSFVALMRNVI